MRRNLHSRHFWCLVLLLVCRVVTVSPYPQASHFQQEAPLSDPDEVNEDSPDDILYFPLPASDSHSPEELSEHRRASARRFTGSICVRGTNPEPAYGPPPEKSSAIVQSSKDQDVTLPRDDDSSDDADDNIGEEESLEKGASRTVDLNTASSLEARTDRHTNRVHQTVVDTPVDIPCDTYVCDCTKSKKKAACCGRAFKLRHVPRVPGYVRQFRLWMASLVNLTREKLNNVSNFDIEYLDLSNNRIKFLAHDTFADFHNLKSLSLGENPISVTMLRDAFYSISLKSFSVLRLDDMILGDTLPLDFLRAFDNHKFKNLSLARNGLTEFDTRVFAGLRQVEKLHLTDNDISSFRLDVAIGVKSIRMQTNLIDALPELCTPEGETAFPILISLYLSSNPIRKIPPGSLKGRCLPRLLKLDISGANIQTLEDNFISDLPRLDNLIANDMMYLNEYKAYCFNSSSLRKLSLRNNKPWVRGTVNPETVFAHSSKLESLTLTNTQINLIDDLFRPILLSLKTIRVLRMQGCKLGSIPPDTLWRLPRLTDLLLTSNRINAFTLTAALRNVTQIKRLAVNGNNINTVNESTIPLEFRQSVKFLDLGGNPYDCTCSLLWFKSWVESVRKAGNITIGSWPRQYICNTPADMKHTRVVDYNPSYRDCHPVSIIVVVGGAGGCLAFLLLATVSLVYRYRWYLRYYIYRIRRRRQYKYQRLSTEEDEPFEYSIYLAYSEHDLEWVVAEIVPLLEAQVQKVFLKNRDIRGGTVADNIVTNMDRSERICLILSDAYTREGWSGYEFQHVLFACMEQGKDVIIVLKGDLEAGRMTKYMRRMLTRGTFLQWEDTEEARSTFRNGLMVAIGTGGYLQ